MCLQYALDRQFGIFEHVKARHLLSLSKFFRLAKVVLQAKDELQIMAAATRTNKGLAAQIPILSKATSSDDTYVTASSHAESEASSGSTNLQDAISVLKLDDFLPEALRFFDHEHTKQAQKTHTLLGDLKGCVGLTDVLLRPLTTRTALPTSSKGPSEVARIRSRRP